MSPTGKVLAAGAFLALMPWSIPAISEEGPPRATRPAPLRSFDVGAVASWLRGLYTEEEFRALASDAVGIESRQCGCYDQPEPHYPYSVTVLTTPKGDLILRIDGSESNLTFVRLAVRRGDLYCATESGAECFGRFADICDFTDHRYGAQLAPFFPTCKSSD